LFLGQSSITPTVRLLDRRLLALAPLLLACACRDAPPPSKEEGYGEPVGVLLNAAGALPAMEIALAVDRGTEIDPLVTPLSRVLHEAVKACPDFVRASAAGGVTQMAFAIDQGKVEEPVASGAHPDACLAASLRGQSVAPLPAGAPPRLRVLAQIRNAPAPQPSDDP
jgi:hypothetical protein